MASTDGVYKGAGHNTAVMGRHLYGAAALFAAVVAGQTSSSDAAQLSLPQGGLMINNQNYAAYNYTNEPFQCTTPTVQLNVNATHAWMLITSYSQAANDVRGGNAPYGRAQWAWSTFVESVAYPPSSLWDPVSKNPSIADMSTDVANGATYQPARDPFRWDGSCAVGTNFADSNIAAAYTTASTTTIAPSPSIGTSALRTPDLASFTFQAAGCNCAAYAMYGDGMVQDLTQDGLMETDNMYPCRSGLDGNSSIDIFYTRQGNLFKGRAPAVNSGQLGVNQANNTHGWTVRQSTCGSSWRDTGKCETSTGANPYKYYKGINTVTGGTCSLKTEALMIMPVEQFLVRLTDSGAVKKISTGSVLSYTWEEYVVEYASTKGTTGGSGVDAYPNGGVDTFQTRVTPSRFQINLYPAGAVVQSLAVGDVAPPMMMHTTATGSAGAVSWAQRDATNGNILKMTWQYDSFVQQSNQASAATGADTLFMSSEMTKSTSATVTKDTGDLSLGPQLVIASTSDGDIYANDYSWTCDKWSTQSANTRNTSTMQNTGTMMTVGTSITSGYSCAKAGCAPVPQTELPGDLLAGLTSAAASADLHWVQYHVTVECTITAIWNAGASGWNTSQTFNLPATTIKMGYRLEDALHSELTDSVTPPFSEIVQVGYASPGLIKQSVNFNVSSRLIQLNESVIKTATDLSFSDLIYQTENNPPLPQQLVYSQAMALKVQIMDDTTNQAIRNEWQLQPALMLMVAHDTATGTGFVPFDSGYKKMSLETGNQLPADWCGLNQAVAVIDPVTGLNSGGPLVAAWAVTDQRTATQDNSGTFLSGYLTTNTTTGFTINKLGPQYNNISDGLSTDLQNELGYLLNNNPYSNIHDLQFDITNNVPTDQGGSKATSYVAIATDASGGFAFPLRNRFFINGKPSGYQLSFCTITQAMPYLPQAVGVCYDETNCNAQYPMYPTAAAALADTMAVGGTVHDPIAYVNPTTTIKYYMPSLPASTGGLICYTSDNIAAAITGGPTASAATLQLSSTSAPCKALMLTAKSQTYSADGNTNQGGRRLLANTRPIHPLYPVQATTFTVGTSASARPAAPRVAGASTRILPKTFTDAVPVAEPPMEAASPPPMAVPTESPTPSPTPSPTASPSPEVIRSELPIMPPPAVATDTRGGRLNLGGADSTITNWTATDASELSAMNTTIAKFTTPRLILIFVAIIITFALSVLVCVGVTFFCMRWRRYGPQDFLPAKSGALPQSEEKPAPGGEAGAAASFRGSSRAFGSGPARMQWRAY